MKKNVTSFLKEIGIVVIGVLIAVSINNIKESIDNKRYIKKTLTAIDNEMVQNQEEVNEIMNRHIILIDSIPSTIVNRKETLGMFIVRLGGIQSPDIENIGLRFFISNKAELVDYEIISKLSKIESHTNVFNMKMEKLFDFISDNMTKSDSDVKIKFKFYLSNVIDSEYSLLKLYSEYSKDKLKASNSSS